MASREANTSTSSNLFNFPIGSAPFQVLRLTPCLFPLRRPFLVGFELRPDRGLLFCLFPRLLFLALFLFRFQRGGILGKGDLFAAPCFCFQLVSGGGVVDDTVKIVVVLLDSVLDVL